jgi:hypothetical protein
MTEKIDNLIKPFLQREVAFNFKHKTYKSGKLLLYKLSGNYLSFIVVNEKKKETFEIPFPYAAEGTNDKVIFDYRLETLAENDYDLLLAIKGVTKVKNSRFYDSVLTISSL